MGKMISCPACFGTGCDLSRADGPRGPMDCPVCLGKGEMEDYTLLADVPGIEYLKTVIHKKEETIS